MITKVCWTHPKNNRSRPNVSLNSAREQRWFVYNANLQKFLTFLFWKTLPSRQKTRYFCGLCKEYLGKSTFYKHKKRYYNHSSRTWQLVNSAKTCGATLLIDQDHILFDGDLLEESLSELQGFFGTFFIMFSLCYFISLYKIYLN